MDSIDLKILQHLKDNARAKASAIGDSIKLSVSAVTERIKKMEQTGIIRQYTVILDQKKIGNDISAIMEVALEHPHYEDSFTAMVMGISNIVSCDCVTGEYDYILHIVTDSTDGLHDIYRTVRSMSGVSRTKTYQVLRRVKIEHAVLPKQD